MFQLGRGLSIKGTPKVRVESSCQGKMELKANIWQRLEERLGILFVRRTVESLCRILLNCLCCNINRISFLSIFDLLLADGNTRILAWFLWSCRWSHGFCRLCRGTWLWILSLFWLRRKLKIFPGEGIPFIRGLRGKICDNQMEIDWVDFWILKLELGIFCIFFSGNLNLDTY